MTAKKITLADIREEALLARMPGRRSFWRRRAPEIWAAVIYGTLLLFWVWCVACCRPADPGDLGVAVLPRSSPLWQELLISSAYGTYFLASLVLFFGALTSGALAWARERDRGTLEPLLLTPMNFSAVVSVRFWLVLWPWARLMLWLLPLYLLIGGGGFFAEAAHLNEPEFGSLPELRWRAYSQCMFMPKLSMAYALSTDHSQLLTAVHWSLGGGLLALARFVNDLSMIVFVCAAAYFVSARASSGARALAASCLLAPLALAAILAAQTAVWFILADFGFAAITALVARIWLALWLVRRAARNFNWYALGEKSPDRSSATDEHR